MVVKTLPEECHCHKLLRVEPGQLLLVLEKGGGRRKVDIFFSGWRYQPKLRTFRKWCYDEI